MYNEHFGFGELPFGVSADARHFYSNAVFQEVLDTLSNGLADKNAFMVVTGEAGTGKTTLLRRLIFNLAGSIDCTLISVTPDLSATALLRTILNDLRVFSSATEKDSLSEQLNGYVRGRIRQGGAVALLFDEAQSLSDEVLKEFPSLFMQSDGQSLIPIVLAGQPELDRRLDDWELRPLKQRLTGSCRMMPLREQDVAPYLATRLEAVGYRGDELFEPAAIGRVIDWSRGIPRLINALCDNALLRAYRSAQHRVTAGMIDDVAVALCLDDHSPGAEPAIRAKSAEPRNSEGVLLPASLVAVSQDNEPASESEEFTAPLSTSTILAHSSSNMRIVGGLNHQPRKANRTIISIGAGVIAVAAAWGWTMLNSQREAPVSSAEVSRENLGAAAHTIAAAPAEPMEDAELGAGVKNPPAPLEVAPPPVPAEPTEDAELGTAVHNPPQPLEATPPAAPPAQQAQEQSQPATAEKQKTAEVKAETKPVSEEVYRVGGASFVRDKPSADAAIIDTLQPGVRVVVTRSGDYFRVRSISGAPRSGFVHKEDAFFDRVQ